MQQASLEPAAAHTAGAALSAQRISSIDGLRAFAFLLVFVFHTWEFAGSPTIPIVSAVVSQNTRPDFFVVLTGFVLTLPFARSPGRQLRTRDYLQRRARRIVIPYYAALVFAVLLPQLLVVVMRLIGRSARWQDWPSWADWVWHLSFLHILSPEHWNGINGSLWTMSLEMQLYVLFPIVLLLYARWGIRAAVGALAVGWAYRVIGGSLIAGSGFPNEFLVGANGFGRVQELLAGMLCAMLIFRRGIKSTRERIVLAVLIVGGYALAVSPLGNMPMFSVREIGLGLAFASLVALVITSSTGTKLFGWKPVSWTGYRSYSFFLIHQPLMWYFSEMTTKLVGVSEGVPALILLWTVGLAITIGVGQIFFMLVERPCISWAKRTSSTSSDISSVPPFQNGEPTKPIEDSARDFAGLPQAGPSESKDAGGGQTLRAHRVIGSVKADRRPRNTVDVTRRIGLEPDRSTK